MSGQIPRILLVESQYVLRRTVAMVGREQGAADFEEVSNVGRARTLLETENFHGVVLDLQDDAAALALLHDLRQGKFACAVDAPVIAVTTGVGAEQEARLQALAVSQVLRKPFKIGELLAAIAEAAKPPSRSGDPDLLAVAA